MGFYVSLLKSRINIIVAFRDVSFIIENSEDIACHLFGTDLFNYINYRTVFYFISYKLNLECENDFYSSCLFLKMYFYVIHGTHL